MSQACVPDSPVKGIQVLHPRALPGVTFSRGIEVAHPYPRHWHDELHICAYDKGAGDLFYRGNTYPCRPGDVAITPPGEVHENRVTTGSGVSFYSVYIPISVLRNVSEQLEASDPESSFRLTVGGSHLGPRLVATHQAMLDGASLFACEELWFELLLGLVEKPFGGSRTINVPNDRDPTRVSMVRDYIEAHFTRSISLQELTAVAGVSVFHLNRLFRVSAGMPPHEYQTQLRINYSKRLLSKRISPADVAVLAGFTDQSHLTRHFKRLVGTTPAKFSA